MTVKGILKHYSRVSEGRVHIQVGNENGISSHSFEGLIGLVERDAPILKRQVRVIYVKDGNLFINTY